MFSRPEEIKVTRTDLHEALDSTLSLLRGKLKDRIRLVKNYGEIPQVECYESQIKQVFMNVLVNAVQSIEGEGTITLTTSLEAGERVSISIRDTGRGMSDLVRRRIFDPFFTTRPKGGGTGLGLSISHSILKEHGGSLGIQSVQGHGTAVTLTLPIRLAGRPRATAGFVAETPREGFGKEAEPSDAGETPDPAEG
jgi:signal transduction histidine kinase